MSDQEDEISTIFTFSQDVSEQKEPEIIPAGEYPAVVRKVVSKISANSGQPMMQMTFWVSPDAYPVDYAEDGDPDGVNLQFYQMMTDKPQQRYLLKRLCEDLGVIPSITIDAKDFEGCNAVIEIVHEPYQERMTARIKRVSEEL